MPAFLYFYRSSRLDGKCFCVDSDTVSCFQGAGEGKKKRLKKIRLHYYIHKYICAIWGKGNGRGVRKPGMCARAGGSHTLPIGKDSTVAVRSGTVGESP